MNAATIYCFPPLSLKKITRASVSFAIKKGFLRVGCAQRDIFEFLIRIINYEISAK